MTESGISMVNPMVVTIHTNVYVRKPIQLMAMMNVNITKPRQRGRRRSGTVRKNVNLMGNINNHPIFEMLDSGYAMMSSGGSSGYIPSVSSESSEFAELTSLSLSISLAFLSS